MTQASSKLVAFLHINFSNHMLKDCQSAKLKIPCFISKRSIFFRSVLMACTFMLVIDILGRVENGMIWNSIINWRCWIQWVSLKYILQVKLPMCHKCACVFNMMLFLGVPTNWTVVQFYVLVKLIREVSSWTNWGWMIYI